MSLELLDAKPGTRAVVTELGDNPLQTIEEHLRLEAQPVPDPADLSPTDIVIAVRSAAVGWVDLLMTSGQYQHVPSPPYVPGMEYAGEVIWTGSEVDKAKVTVGSSVIADGFHTGPRSLGDYQRHGGFATYAVAPARAALPLPRGFSFDQGCCFLGNYETAFHCLITCGGLDAGETVLIHGATGSTGLAAVHLAKIVGATVIATGRSPTKLEEVRRQGADHVICLSHPDGSPGVRPFKDEVKALTAGKGVDVVYDSVGGEVSLQSMRCVTFGARFLIVGWASTPFVAKGRGQRGAPNANHLPTNLIMMKGLKVIGCPTVISTHRDPSLRPIRLGQLMRWAEEGKLQPYVRQSFPLSEVKAAMQAKWSSDYVGGCVIHPSLDG